MEIAHRLEVKIPFALACLLLVAGTVEAGEKADSKSWSFRTPVRPGPPAKRSGHVALLLMGTFAVGTAAYAVMPRDNCERSPNLPSRAW